MKKNAFNIMDVVSCDFPVKNSFIGFFMGEYGSNCLVYDPRTEDSIKVKQSLLSRYDAPKSAQFTEWSVGDYEETPEFSEETIAFKALLYFNDKECACVRNNGQGSADFYAYATKEMCHAHKNAINDFTRVSGKYNSCIAEEDFFQWLLWFKPIGVCVEDFIEIQAKNYPNLYK